MMDPPKINYNLLAKAETFYLVAGFQRVGASWSVGESTIKITAPKGSTLFLHKEGRPKGIKDVPNGENFYLVASGEQSLLELVLLNKQFNCPFEGRFLAITPCFRDEFVLTPLTRAYFMKVELFDNQNTTEDSLEEIMDLCKTWFSKRIPCKIVETDQAASDPIAISPTYDIVSLSDIELGSYGIREHPRVGKWIYATGCAEPRLSQAMKDNQ